MKILLAIMRRTIHFPPLRLRLAEYYLYAEIGGRPVLFELAPDVLAGKHRVLDKDAANALAITSLCRMNMRACRR
jgi:hypothetical protein